MGLNCGFKLSTLIVVFLGFVVGLFVLVFGFFFFCLLGGVAYGFKLLVFV